MVHRHGFLRCPIPNTMITIFWLSQILIELGKFFVHHVNIWQSISSNMRMLTFTATTTTVPDHTLCYLSAGRNVHWPIHYWSNRPVYKFPMLISHFMAHQQRSCIRHCASTPNLSCLYGGCIFICMQPISDVKVFLESPGLPWLIGTMNYFLCYV